LKNEKYLKDLLEMADSIRQTMFSVLSIEMLAKRGQRDYKRLTGDEER
jgi:hypothetical protein